MNKDFSSEEERLALYTKGWLECPYCRKERERNNSEVGKGYYFLRHHMEVECKYRPGEEREQEHKNVTPGDLEAAEIHHLRKREE